MEGFGVRVLAEGLLRDGREAGQLGRREEGEPRRRRLCGPAVGERSARDLDGLADRTSPPAPTRHRRDRAERPTHDQLVHSHAGPTPDGTGLRTAPPPPRIRPQAGGVVTPGKAYVHAAPPARPCPGSAGPTAPGISPPLPGSRPGTAHHGQEVSSPDEPTRKKVRVLRPVVEPMLAKAVDALPAPPAFTRFAAELKYDGYRALLFTGTRGGPVLLQSRRGNLLQGAFPDLVTAAREQLPEGLVLDGEVVVWNGTELSFAAVQRRASSGTRNAQQLARSLPAHYVAFDVLQFDGDEGTLMARPYIERRAVLEGLFADRGLTAPWTLCPMTRDREVAAEWLRDWTLVPGLEGLVIKPVAGRYTPGSRRGGWSKIRRRDTTEAIVGAITGTLTRPQLLVLGRHDASGALRSVGRTTVLRPETARQFAGRLTPAGPDHPWAGVRFTTVWGRDPIEPLLVAPELIAEISTDPAVDRGVYRHPVRFLRLRLDQTTADVPPFGTGSAGG